MTVKSDISDDAIMYVEDGRIVDMDLPARASYILKRLGPTRTFMEFRVKWLCSPEAPREVTEQILADFRVSLETIKMICEEPQTL